MCQECVRLAQLAVQVMHHAPLFLTYITRLQLQPLLNHVLLGASTATSLVEFNMKFRRQSNMVLMQALGATIFQLYQQV